LRRQGPASHGATIWPQPARDPRRALTKTRRRASLQRHRASWRAGWTLLLRQTPVPARAVDNGEAKSALEQTGRHKLRLKRHWIADHDFRYQIGDAGYSDFFVFLPRLGVQAGTNQWVEKWQKNSWSWTFSGVDKKAGHVGPGSDISIQA